MSAIVITENGLSRKSFQEIRQELKNSWISTFGSAIDLSESSPDGHHIDLEAKEISSIAELIQAVYSCLTLDGAYGIWVDIFMSYRGITRIGASYSTVNATFYGEVGTLIPAGTEIRLLGNSVRFLTNEAVTIGEEGNVAVIATANEIGAIPVDAGEWILVSDIEGVTVSVLTTGSIGRLEETDTQLKERGKKYVHDGLATLETIPSYIQSNVQGVTDCSIKENATASEDEDGRPPFSIEIYVSGGDDNDVAKAILTAKPAGIKAYGLKFPNGYDIADSKGTIHNVNWTVPSNCYLWLRISITEYDEEVLPDNYQDVIKDSILSWMESEFVFGKDVIPQRISIPVYACSGVEFVTVEAALMYNSEAVPSGYTTSRIAVSNAYKVISSAEKIQVTLS